MARMYPENIDRLERATAGEKKVFRFLETAARPHKSFLCWYEPSIGPVGEMPDFVLFGERVGLFVLEVKDWTVGQVISFTPHRFTVQIAGKARKRNNPDKQARGYVHRLMDVLKTFPGFLSKDTRFFGQLKIPIGRMVVFPNMDFTAYCKRGLQWLIPKDRVLLSDDMTLDGEILRDPSGKKFIERIAGTLPFRFTGLTREEKEILGKTLWPASTIEVPPRQGRGRSRFQADVQALDQMQVRAALRLGRGHQLIKGPPGSGKTLILIHRCCQMVRYRPGMTRVLLVCYNIALVSYLKGLIREKGIGFGGAGIHVYHYFEFCARILGEPVQYENQDSAYYDRIVEAALGRLREGTARIDPFDGIFIDEGQDFSRDMLRTLTLLLNKDGDLVVAMDSYQDLYGRRSAWSAAGIKIKGRTTHLKRAYRNTAELFDFTQCFLANLPKSGVQLALLPDGFSSHGPRPEIVRFQGYEEIESFLVRDLTERIERSGYKRSEIAIIYDDKLYGPAQLAYDNRALPMRIMDRLSAANVAATWVSKDVRSKEMFDITNDRVSVISIHSAKGLDFELVYLVGLDHIHHRDLRRNYLVSTVYVALTRAKYRLIIPYIEESELITRMKRCLET